MVIGKCESSRSEQGDPSEETLKLVRQHCEKRRHRNILPNPERPNPRSASMFFLRIKLSFLLFHRREKTHDSATNKIGINLISRPFSLCQSLLIYQQLVTGKCAMEFSPTTLTLSSTTSRTSCRRPSWSSSSWRSVSIAGGPGT
nr:97FR [Ipomoea batatas]